MTSYSDWLETQSTEFQDVALGKKRAVAFRNGERVEKYIEHGKPLSLDELNDTHKLSLGER